MIATGTTSERGLFDDDTAPVSHSFHPASGGARPGGKGGRALLLRHEVAGTRNQLGNSGELRGAGLNG